MEHIRSGSAQGRSWRVKAVRFFFYGACGVIIFRLFTLQVVNAQFYTSIAEDQHELYRELIAERGDIYVSDWRDGAQFLAATNEPRAFIFADPRKISDPKDAAQKIGEVLGYTITDVEAVQEVIPAANRQESIADLLDEGEEEVAEEVPSEIPKEENPPDVQPYLSLLERLSKKDDPYEPVARNIPEEQLQKILDFDIAGINYVYENVRVYPEKNLGGHIFGFVGATESGGRTGRYGIEGYFEKLLAGENGFLDAVGDQLGRWIGVGRRQFEPAVDGGDVYLTIDRTIQYVACNKLREGVARHQADGGTLVILEPKTGRIMAMCSAPDFDPNAYNEVEDIAAFNNRAVSLPYEPGSVFKPLVMAAALDAGVITPTTTYTDTGEVTIVDHTIRNSDLKANGVQTMVNVLEKSLNTGMIFVMRQIGAENMKAYIQKFGFGETVGIELQGEAAGTIASLNQKGEIYPATASFGQGITVTPLQLAQAYGALANGGVMMKPYIVDEVHKPDGVVEKRYPQEVRRVISQKAATTIGAMMVSVVEEGHAVTAAVDGYYIAGKTGTAQVARSDGRGYETNYTRATFTGFGPIDDPQFVAVVMIDRPRTSPWADSTASPIFAEIAEFLVQYLQIPPKR